MQMSRMFKSKSTTAMLNIMLNDASWTFDVYMFISFDHFCQCRLQKMCPVNVLKYNVEQHWFSSITQ